MPLLGRRERAGAMARAAAAGGARRRHRPDSESRVRRRWRPRRPRRNSHFSGPDRRPATTPRGEAWPAARAPRVRKRATQPRPRDSHGVASTRNSNQHCEEHERVRAGAAPRHAAPETIRVRRSGRADPVEPIRVLTPRPPRADSTHRRRAAQTLAARRSARASRPRAACRCSRSSITARNGAEFYRFKSDHERAPRGTLALAQHAACRGWNTASGPHAAWLPEHLTALWEGTIPSPQTTTSPLQHTRGLRRGG